MELPLLHAAPWLGQPGRHRISRLDDSPKGSARAGARLTAGPVVQADRCLKHRARGATRLVPAPPPLCDLLGHHLARFGAGFGSRLFSLRRTPTGRLIPGKTQPVSANTYAAVWRRARQAALTPAQQRSPLARRP
jgi:hypothetical protein